MRQRLPQVEELLREASRLVGEDPGEDLAARLRYVEGRILALNGDYAEATRLFSRVVDYYRRLLATIDAADETELSDARRSLADALRFQADALYAIGRIEAASRAYEESLLFYPSADKANRASVLADYSIVRGELRDYSGALSAIQEAESIYEGLASTDPEVHAPGLADSLNKLGILILNRPSATELRALTNIFSESPPKVILETGGTKSLKDLVNLQDRDRLKSSSGLALRSFYDSLMIYRRLAATRPDAFDPMVARTVSNLGILLGAMGEHGAARGAYEEALEVYQKTDSHSQEYQTQRATTLNSLGATLEALDDPGGACDAYTEALEVFRRAASTRPEKFQQDVAMTASASLAGHSAEKPCCHR